MFYARIPCRSGSTLACSSVVLKPVVCVTSQLDKVIHSWNDADGHASACDLHICPRHLYEEMNVPGLGISH